MKILKKITGAVFTALLLFNPIRNLNAALPLTQTIYTIPESEIEFGFREEILRLDNSFRRERYSLGIGVLSRLSVWYSFEYLHNGIIDASENKLGDSFFKIWLYINEYMDIFHAGISLTFRIPTGVDAYSESNWRNVSFGNDELKVGPVFKIDITEAIFSHINLFYVFRQRYGEDFYGGFYLNPVKKETYTKIFGFNFKAENTFLESSRLKNDYIIFSTALNSNLIYPVIPYIEFYSSYRIRKNNSDEYSNIAIEGSGINPVLISAGSRYFFSEDFYLGLYYIYNPKDEKNFIKDIIGFDFSLQF